MKEHIAIATRHGFRVSQPSRDFTAVWTSQPLTDFIGYRSHVYEEEDGAILHEITLRSIRGPRVLIGLVPQRFLYAPDRAFKELFRLDPMFMLAPLPGAKAAVWRGLLDTTREECERIEGMLPARWRENMRIITWEDKAPPEYSETTRKK